MNKKTVALLMACVLLVGAAIGGTMAWLVDSTGEVTNTFTVGDINIELKEHKLNADERTLSETYTDPNKTGGDGNNYHFLPGDTLPKDPFVTVKAKSEDCYLFVKIDEANNTNNSIEGNNKKIINWTIADGWTLVSGQTNVWYKEITKSDADSNPIYILKGDNADPQKYATGCITVNEGVTKAMVDTINGNADKQITAAKPTLTFTAAAVQSKNINGVDAAFAQTPFAPAP